jgi:uncharacterized beta-barrel protein YwiB (DUF1934 family)
LDQKERKSVNVFLETWRSDGTNEETEAVEGRGYLWETDGIRYLSYESSGEGREGFRQQIELWPGKVVVRTPAADGGSRESRMTFRVGERLAADYHTPYGSLPIETHTRKHWVSKNGGEGLQLRLEYDLYLDGARLMECRMRVTAENES